MTAGSLSIRGKSMLALPEMEVVITLEEKITLGRRKLLTAGDDLRATMVKSLNAPQ